MATDGSTPRSPLATGERIVSVDVRENVTLLVVAACAAPYAIALALLPFALLPFETRLAVVQEESADVGKPVAETWLLWSSQLWLVILCASLILLLSWRVLTRRTVLSGHVLSRYRTFDTAHIPLTNVRTIAGPWPPHGRPGGVSVLVLDDGASVEVDDATSDRRLNTRLDAIVSSGTAEDRRAAPSYPPDHGRRARLFSPLALAALACAAAFSAASALEVVLIHRADVARTAVNEAATVVHVSTTSGDPDRTNLDVVVPGTNRVVRITHPERLAVDIEDPVRVDFDPDDVENIVLSDRPHAEHVAVAWVLLAVAVPVCAASVTAGIALGVGRWRQARRVKEWAPEP